MGERRFIPLGTYLTPEEARSWSLTDLRDRSIYDPRFAGLDATFDWRHYVTLDFNDAEFHQQVEASLDQMSRTAEGQQVLRQALANRVFEQTGILPTGAKLLDPSLHMHRISITDYVEEDGQRYPIEAATSHSGRIGISRSEIHSMEYETASRGWANMTVQEVLFHELGHAADGLVGPNITILNAAHSDIARLAREARVQFPENAEELRFEVNARDVLSHYAVEYPVMRTSSEYVQRQFGMEPQWLAYKSFRDDPDGGQRFFQTLRQPDLPANPRPPGDHEHSR